VIGTVVFDATIVLGARFTYIQTKNDPSSSSRVLPPIGPADDSKPGELTSFAAFTVRPDIGLEVGLMLMAPGTQDIKFGPIKLTSLFITPEAIKVLTCTLTNPSGGRYGATNLIKN
jgi:hypothetical protein